MVVTLFGIIISVILAFELVPYLLGPWSYLLGFIPVSWAYSISAVAADLGIDLPVPRPWYRRWLDNVGWSLIGLYYWTAYISGNILSGAYNVVSSLSLLLPY
jgi:hypothetical protein